MHRAFCFRRAPSRPAPLQAWTRWCSHSPAHHPQSSAVLGNSGHPELSAFVDSLSSGSASLDVTFTPGFYTDGSNALTFSGTCASVCPDAACRMGLSSVAESLGAMASVAPLVSHMSLPLLLGNTLAARNVVADAD